ncbi:MAG: hypothetical protein AVDCRST_MAG85-2818, partial [uncultured Solirubrobacteraceae bacterium]
CRPSHARSKPRRVARGTPTPSALRVSKARSTTAPSRRPGRCSGTPSTSCRVAHPRSIVRQSV